jgi:hypothetical protein
VPSSQYGAFGVSSHTIESAERRRARIAPTDAQLASIRRALEAAGVGFTNGDEPGVELKAMKARGEK